MRSIHGAFKTASKKTGIQDFRFHDLRHTFNTNMRKAGAHRSVIMKITGHKTGVMFDRYNTVDAEDARLAMRLYEDYLGLQTTSWLLQDPSEPKKTGQAELLNPLI
jgi:integrase